MKKETINGSDFDAKKFHVKQKGSRKQYITVYNNNAIK